MNENNLEFIVGWTDSNVITNISNSYVSAYFNLSGNNGNTFGRNPNYVKLTNCYYLNALSDDSTATKMSAESFASGEVAYKLNNGKTDGTQAWYQTCQSDSYPKFSGETVYMGYVCGSGSSDPVYRNSMDGLISVSSPEHSWKDGVCTNCGTTQVAYVNEYGKTGQPARPFVRTANEKAADSAIEAAARVYDEYLKSKNL